MKLEFDRLTKRYGAKTALDDVALTFNPGNVAALIGPSGAGKSTLIRCVNRLVEPSAGEVVVDGGPVTGLGGGALRAARRRH